jgi:hypothetical protein
MWYTFGYANTLICAPAHGGRAGYPGDRPPVTVRLHSPALSESPHQRRGPGDSHNCSAAALYRPNGTPCHSCLPPARSRSAAPPPVATTHDLDHLRYWGLRVPPVTAAPPSADLRQAHQPVDLPTRRRAECCAGPHTAPGQRRGHAGGPPSVGRVVETGPTLAHQPRSGLGPKKNRRDRLIQRARTQPTWALGFGDEVWWSRLAQPNQHCWTEAETTHTLQELSPPMDDPDPKALACNGLLLRLGPQQQPHPMGLRCVTGRPVSAVTSDFLSWCSAQLAAQGFTALVLIWDHASWHRSHAVRHWMRQHH